jgi:hypothetical protein
MWVFGLNGTKGVVARCHAIAVLGASCHSTNQEGGTLDVMSSCITKTWKQLEILYQQIENEHNYRMACDQKKVLLWTPGPIVRGSSHVCLTNLGVVLSTNMGPS